MEGPHSFFLGFHGGVEEDDQWAIEEGKGIAQLTEFCSFLCFFFPSLVSSLNFLAALWVQVSQEKN